MLGRLLIKILFSFSVVILLLSGCTAKRNIAVTDGSTIATSRKSFFDSLYSNIELKNNITSYYSKKYTISADGIPVYNSLNATMSFERGSNYVSKLYVPFPVIEVGKVMIDKSNLFFTSKPLGKDNEVIPFPSYLLTTLQSALVGSVPDVYKVFNENDFSSFKLYIENNEYVLSKSKGSDFEVKIHINPDMSLSSINVCYNDTFYTFACGEYCNVDGFSIPLLLDIAVVSPKEKSEYKAKVSIKSVNLNGKKKVVY